jgi:hypothetical protein
MWMNPNKEGHFPRVARRNFENAKKRAFCRGFRVFFAIFARRRARRARVFPLSP